MNIDSVLCARIKPSEWSRLNSPDIRQIKRIRNKALRIVKEAADRSSMNDLLHIVIWQDTLTKRQLRREVKFNRTRRA